MAGRGVGRLGWADVLWRVVVVLVLAFAGPVLRWLLAFLALTELPVRPAAAFLPPAFGGLEAPCTLVFH